MAFDHYFDRRAGRFSAFYRSEQLSRLLGRGALFDRLAFAVAKADSISARRVLDVGCGGGPLFEPLASSGVHVTGVEPAPRMVALAREAARTFPELVEVRAAGWESIDDTDAYDLAAALGVFDYVDTPVELLTTMRRAARFVVASFPGPGLRTGLRTLRYGRQGVQVYGYTRERITEASTKAGLVVEELAPLGTAGYALFASRDDQL